MSQIKVDQITDEAGTGAPDFPNGVTTGNPFLLKAIGEPFAIWDHISGCPIPSNAGSAKFIKLTAGLTGTGGYNQGLLTAESVSGSSPLVQATAEITAGPLAGQIVPLINTEGAFVRPGTSSGSLQLDQMQRITGDVRRIHIDSSDVGNGALSLPTTDARDFAAGGNAMRRGVMFFDSANSPDARVSATTTGETRPKNRQATYYMRIV
jgi:hypothetical protein